MPLCVTVECVCSLGALNATVLTVECVCSLGALNATVCNC